MKSDSKIDEQPSQQAALSAAKQANAHAAEQITKQQITELRDILKSSNKTVFFGGAGVSTESGIPDFRSPGGLYSQKYKFPPEEILSHSFFMRNTVEFYKFYIDKILCQRRIKEFSPNAAHSYFAKHKIPVITQNIDGLHTRALLQADSSLTVDSTDFEYVHNIFELHGSVMRNYCLKCQKFYDLDTLLEQIEVSDDNVPRCNRHVEADGEIKARVCNGLIKPDVVLYEEGLSDKVIQKSVDLIANADTLIVGGTSLTVYPAAGLIRYFSGDNLVLINGSETNYDNLADLVIRQRIGEVFAGVEAPNL